MPLKDKYISSYLVRRQLFFCCLCVCWLRVICKASLLLRFSLCSRSGIDLVRSVAETESDVPSNNVF